MSKESIEIGLEEAAAVKGRKFISSFPPETAGGGVYGAYASDFQKMSMENIHDLSKITYGKILSRFGGATKDFGAFGDLVVGFDSFSPAEFMEAWKAIAGGGDALEIADEVLDVVGTAWGAVGSVGEMGEAVPIIGIFVQLANFLISTGKSTRRAVGDVFYPIEDVKMEYAKANDEMLVNVVLSAMKGKDWTRIFSPPSFPSFGDHSDSRASGIEHSNVRWAGGAGQGVVITIGTGSMGSGFGFHPQTTRIPIAWQYHTGDPKKGKTRKKWTYKKGLHNRVDGFEEFHPALQQLSVLLWQRLLRNTPEIFRVDAISMRAQWSTYFKTMEQYLTRKNDEWGMGKTPEYVRPMTKGVIERILSPEYWGNGDAVNLSKVTEGPEGLIFHWKILGKEVPMSYYTDPKKLIFDGMGGDYLDLHWRGADPDGRKGKTITAGEEWVYGVSGPRLTARGLTEFIIDESLKSRQWKYLNTLTVAYLTPDMPAFQNWPELLQKFHQNRNTLLKHQARIWVDLDRVPDSTWKVKLKESVKGIPPGMKYTLPLAKIKAAGDGGDVIPNSDSSGGNPIPLIPQVSRMTLKKEGGGGGAGIAIAAAAGLGLVLMSGKK